MEPHNNPCISCITSRYTNEEIKMNENQIRNEKPIHICEDIKEDFNASSACQQHYHKGKHLLIYMPPYTTMMIEVKYCPFCGYSIN